WFQLREGAVPSTEIPILTPEFVTLVIGNGLPTLLEGRSRRALEQDVLPYFLGARRWFGEKGTALLGTSVETSIPLDKTDPNFSLALVVATTPKGRSRYLLPLTIKWTRFDRLKDDLPNALAAVRRGAREGTLLDACAERVFISLLLDTVHTGERIGLGAHKLEFRPTRAFLDMEKPSVETVRVVDREQSNTTVIADAKFVVKVF